MTSRWRVGQCEAVLTNLWLTALNQLQPTYVRCPSWPDCLLDQGRTLLNIWLYFHRARCGTCIWLYFHHGTHA
jgi:hypothetical protein